MKVEVCPDGDAASARAAELITEAIRGTLAERGRCAVAFSGGKEPWKMIGAIDSDVLTDEAVTIWQVDERVAPDGDPDRNLTHLRECLPESALERLHPMPVTETDLDAAAESYAAELPEELDVVHLGVGPDGHTASLVPGDTVLEVADRGVAATEGEYEGHRRMTLTYPTLAAARAIVWLVPGEQKREAVGKLIDADPSVPAGRVDQTNAIVVTDEAAAPAG